MGLVRLLLAVSVVLTHTEAPYALAGGRIAVQLFYMISGFLISYVLHKDAAYATVGKFYLARALRIFPPYYAVAAAVLCLFILEHDRLAQFAGLPMATRVFMGVVNLTVLGQDWTSFMSNPAAGGLPLHKFLLAPQAWTLGLELTFYLIAPFIVRRRKVLVGLLIASLAARLFGWSLGLDHDPWSYRFFPFELALFAAGALSHQLVLPWARATDERWQTPVSIAALALAAGATALPLIEPLRSVLVFLAFVGALPFLFLFQRRRRWDAVLGELSYPIYLTHWAVAMVVIELSHRAGLERPPAFTAIVLVGSIAAAVGLDVCIARPVEKLRARIKGSGLDPATRQLSGTRSPITDTL